MDRNDEIEARARKAALDAVCGVEDGAVHIENVLPADLCQRIADAAVDAYLGALTEPPIVDEEWDEACEADENFFSDAVKQAIGKTRPTPPSKP